jgi:hypothetical protein
MPINNSITSKGKKISQRTRTGDYATMPTGYSLVHDELLALCYLSNNNNNNHTFTWPGPSGVLGYTGQRPEGLVPGMCTPNTFYDR